MSLRAWKPLRRSPGRPDSRRNGELVGPRFCGALVSEKNAGSRSARLVRGTLRNGGGQFHVLFRPRSADGGTLVPHDARRVHLRSEAASASVASFDGGET